MTDRVHSFVVVLERDIRVDDVEDIQQALGMVRGVVSVTPNIATLDSHMAEERARHDLGGKILTAVRELVYPTPKR